jgi:hypothetical protein
MLLPGKQVREFVLRQDGGQRADRLSRVPILGYDSSGDREVGKSSGGCARYLSPNDHRPATKCETAHPQAYF